MNKEVYDAVERIYMRRHRHLMEERKERWDDIAGSYEEKIKKLNTECSAQVAALEQEEMKILKAKFGKTFRSDYVENGEEFDELLDDKEKLLIKLSMMFGKVSNFDADKVEKMLKEFGEGK